MLAFTYLFVLSFFEARNWKPRGFQSSGSGKFHSLDLVHSCLQQYFLNCQYLLVSNLCWEDKVCTDFFSTSRFHVLNNEENFHSLQFLCLGSLTWSRMRSFVSWFVFWVSKDWFTYCLFIFWKSVFRLLINCSIIFSGNSNPVFLK